MSRFYQFMMRRVRGVRIMDLMGAACLMVVVLAVYGSKAKAGAEAAKIADANRQIASEEQRVALLRTERAYLTQPERLRRLSIQYLDMAPVKAGHEVAPEALPYAVRTAPAPMPALASPATTEVPR